MNYSEDFKTAVREDILRRIDEDESFAKDFDDISNSLDTDTIRNIAYEKYAQKPEFKKYLDDRSWLSKFGDDLSKIPEAWRAGNFYSEGGWSDIATNVINSATGIGDGGKEQREKLYQEYRTWREKNPSVEAETFLGKVATGVANMVPLTLDMAQESALPVGVGAAAGSVIPGVGTIAGGGTALTASMLTQSAKVGIADMYTFLRDNGIDDEDAMKWALWLSPVYGGLEFVGKAIGPVGRKLFGTMAIKKIVDRIADKKFKQKFANAAAKKLADVATITAAETATEAGQAMTTEVARQGAEGKGFNVGEIAKAGVEEAKAVAPAMLGMAMLGIGAETLGSRISKHLQKKETEATEQVPIENTESKDDVLPEVPFGIKLGETFRGSDGKLYRNVDGFAMPIIENNTEEVSVESTPQTTVAETEATPQPLPQGDAVGNALDNLAEDFGGTEANIEATEQVPVAAEATAEVPAPREYSVGEQMQLDLAKARVGEATIENAIGEADSEIDEEHKSAVDKTDSRIEKAKAEFVKEHFDDYSIDDDEDFLEYYSDSEGETAVKVYLGQYGGNIVEFDKNGKSIFITYDNTESGNRLYKYDSLEKAKIAQLEDAWEEDFSEEDAWRYMDSVYENDETNILQRKFVRAIEKLGIPVKEKQRARTGSEYVYIKTPSGDDMKIRIADHPVVYSADVSIEQGDWKGAVRYVANVYNDWYEDFNEGETINSSVARVDNPQGNVANTEENVDYDKAAEEALEPIFKDIEERQKALDAQNPPAKSRNYRIYGNTPLPKGVEKNKITGVIDGIVSPSAVRKYLAAAFGVNINASFDTHNRELSAAMGVYYGLAEIIRLRGGFINDINVIAHEVGHYLEQAVFGKRAINRAGSAMKNELSDYCRSVFGETAYPFPLQAREGFAQFISDYLQNPEKVEKQCPITYAAMRSVMAKNSNLTKVLGNAQQMIRNYNLATPQERVAATTVSYDEKEYKPFGSKVRLLRNKATDVVHYSFDRLYGLERAYRFLKNEIGEDVINQKDQNFYLLARLLGGKAATNSEWSLNTAQVDLEGNEIGKCLNDIINDSGCTKDELDVIFRARRAKAYYDTHHESTATCRNKFGILWSDVNSIYDSMTEKQKQACKEIDTYQRNMLNMLVVSGVVSDRTAKRLRQQTGYVPLQRVIDEIDGYGAGETSSAPIKRFKGSDRDVYSPLEQIAKNEALFRKIALRNIINRKLYGSITQLQGHADMLTEYKKTSELINLKISEIVEVLSKSELVRDMAEQDGLVNANEKELKKWIAGKIKTDEFFMPIVWRSKAMRDDKRRVLTFYDGGEVKAFQVHDELLFKALKAVDSTTAWKFNGFLGLLHKISKMSASILRATATMNPDFSAANPVRDTTGGMVWTKSSNPFVFAFNALRFGIPASLGYHKEVFNEWYLSGGAFGSLWSDDGKSKRLDLTTLKKDFAQFIKDEQAKLKQDSALKYGLNLARRLPKGTLNALETFSSTFESSARLTEFNQQRKNYIKARTEELVKQGLTEADAKAQATDDWKSNKNNVRSKAALESREITLDFEKGGEHAKEFNKITAFFNVTVLGSARVVQRLMPIDVHSFLDWLETVDLKQYTHDVNEFRRFLFESKKQAKLSARAMVNIAMTTAIGSAITLMTVDEDEDENIPDYERNRFVFFSFGGKTYRIPISPDLIPFMAMMNDFKNSMFRSEDFYNDFSYKAAFMDMLPQFIPTALRPLIEGTTNYSFFRGQPIETQAQKNLLPSDRRTSTTSQTALATSRFLSNSFDVEISPVLLDFYVQSYLAGLGRTGVRYITDPIAERIFKLSVKPTSNAPLEHTFTRNDYASSKFDAKFAETAIDATQAIQSYKQSTDGRVPWRSYSFENFREIYWYAMVHKQIGQINNVIGGINREVKKILNDTNLSADEKRDKIVLWKREKQKITKAAFKYYDYKYNKEKNSKLFKQIDDEAKQAYKLTK